MSLLLTKVGRANPSPVIPLAEDFDVGIGELPGRREEYDGSDERPEDFGDRVRLIFPKGAAARLARTQDVSLRLAQRWISGQNPPPAHVVEWVEQQIRLTQGVNLTEWMKSMIKLLEKRDIHGEVISSQIAAAYEQLIGRDVA